MKRSCHAFFAASRATASPLIALAFACLFCLAAPLHAQTITATVSGTITDPAGAVVPGATVTVTSNERGDARTVNTDDEGRYAIPFLQPGTYTVAVEGTGFGRASRSDVRLEIAQTATLDFALSANVQESVEVEGSTTPLLQTETSQLETTIENKLIEDLPSVERNIFSFVNLVPGTIDAGTALGNPAGAIGSAGNRNFFDSNFAVSGGRASSNDILLDGVSNTIGDFNGVAVSPPQDSVREFKVISGVAPAEYGRTGGGIVNIGTRGGTNRFRGALYEYYQDGSLNANGWQRNRRSLPRIDLRRDQFGGAIGGPVYLPRFGEGGPAFLSGKNSTFFFFNYEARREDNPFTRELTLPTAEQRLGDLSGLLGANRTDIRFANGTPVRVGQIFNPFGALVPYQRVNANGTVTTIQGRPIIPNNRLDLLPICPPGARVTACRDQVAQNVLSFLPLPTGPGLVNNFVLSTTSRFTRDILAARIDRTISDKQSFFGRFSYEKRNDVLPNFFGTPAANARTIADTFGNFTLNHVYSITPTSINNIRYGYTRVRANQIPNSLGFDPTTLGFPAYLTAGASSQQFPDFVFGNPAAENLQGTTPAGEITNGQIGGAGNDQPRDTHTVANAVTLIRGAHTIKAGGEYRLLRFYPFQFFTPSGTFTFARNFTSGPDTTVALPAGTAGSSLATLLLGLPTGGNRETITPLSIYKHYGAGFVQDDYKVGRRLTLNLGLRYEIETGTGEANQLVTNFDLEAPSQLAGRLNLTNLDPAVRALNPGITNLTGLLNFPEGGQTRANRNRFAPRVGFAYSVNDRTTVRGGYGIFYLPLSLEGTSAQGTNFTTNILQTNSNAQVNAGTVFLSDPFPANLFPGGLPVARGNTQGANTQIGQALTAVEPERRTSYNQQYNFVVQRELARNLVLDIAFVGSRGVRLPIQGLNLNQLPRETFDFANAEVAAGRAASVAAFLSAAVANPFQNLIPSTPALNGANIARAQLLRRFPQYQSVTLFRPLAGTSKYNALQVSLQKRLSNGLSATANYTFSKLLDTGGVGNGAAFLDATPVEDVFNFDDEYALSTLDVPHRFTTGFSYELPFGRGRSFGGNLNRVADLFLGGYQVSGIATYQSGAPYPIITGLAFTGGGLAAVGNAVRRPNRVAGSNADFGGDQLRDNARSGSAIFDTTAFTQPGDFEFGNAARTYDDVRRDTYKNVDLSIIKNFGFGEDRKLQVRAEFLNAFNFVVFGTPINNVNVPTNPNVATDANAAPGFGQVTSQGNRPRAVQLVGRFTF